MHQNLIVPDVTEIHRLLRMGAVKGDFRVSLTDVTFLKSTEDKNHIFKAKVSGQDVIVKFTYEGESAIPRLEHESQIYVDCLKPLWGVHVPKFYGFYLYNSLDMNEPSCACIVLQYCGEPAVCDLSQLKDYRNHEYGVKRFRNDTMDIVFRFHSPEIGLEHDGLNASHVLDFNGKPFIIDFAGAEGHICYAWQGVDKLTREVLPAKEGEILQPISNDSVMCYELWTFLESIEYCIPIAIEFDRKMYICETITSAAELYEHALRKRPRCRSKQEIWDESVKKWQFVHSHWKKYHPEVVVEPPLGIIKLEEYLKTR